MPDFLNHLDKTCNFKSWRPIIFSGGSEKPKGKEKWLDQSFAGLTALRQILLGRDINHHCSKSKILGSVQINPQSFVGVAIFKSRKVA